MRVLLVQPASNIMKNRRESKPALQPMGLAYIAGTLLANGYRDVQVLDVLTEGYYNETPFKEDYIRYGLFPEEIKKRIGDYKPDIVGVSCINSLRKYQSHEICSLVKEVDKSILTVVGGNHHTCFPEETLNDVNVDIVCMGEGEQTFLDIVRWLDGKGDFDSVNGIAYNYSGKLRAKPQVNRESNLDNIPFPAHHLLALDKHLEIWRNEGYHYYEAAKFTSTTFARGCTFFCEHCPHQVIFKGYRYRSGKNIVDEIEKVYNELGVTEIQAHEYNSCIVKKQVEDLCHEMIRRGLSKKVRWGWPIGIWIKPLTYDFLALMREAGMFYVDLAIESHSQSLLDTTMKGKDVDLVHTQNVIKWANELDYYINCFFMIGFPEQTRQDIEDTISYSKTLDVHSATFFIAQPLPGTKYWDRCVRQSLFLEGFDTFHLRYGKCNIKMRDLTPAEVENYRWTARQEFVRDRQNKGAKAYDGKRGKNFVQSC